MLWSPGDARVIEEHANGENFVTEVIEGKSQQSAFSDIYAAGGLLCCIVESGCISVL